MFLKISMDVTQVEMLHKFWIYANDDAMTIWRHDTITEGYNKIFWEWEYDLNFWKEKLNKILIKQIDLFE